VKLPAPAILLALLTACAPPDQPPEIAEPQPCSPEWFDSVEAELGTGDGMGHGPDIGSGEWRSVVEFRLGVRDDPAVPDNQSPEWCSYISDLMDERATSAK